MAKSRKIGPILSVIAGIIVIAWPTILAWVVGLFLLITGILDLADKR